jgi:hypothetical protein
MMPYNLAAKQPRRTSPIPTLLLLASSSGAALGAVFTPATGETAVINTAGASVSFAGDLVSGYYADGWKKDRRVTLPTFTPQPEPGSVQFIEAQSQVVPDIGPAGEQALERVRFELAQGSKGEADRFRVDVYAETGLAEGVGLSNPFPPPISLDPLLAEAKFLPNVSIFLNAVQLPVLLTLDGLQPLDNPLMETPSDSRVAGEYARIQIIRGGVGGGVLGELLPGSGPVSFQLEPGQSYRLGIEHALRSLPGDSLVGGFELTGSLTVVPEPEVVAQIALLGLAGLLWASRRS